MLSSSNHRRSLSNISQSLHQELTVELVTSSSKVFDEAEATLREAYEHRVASHGMTFVCLILALLDNESTFLFHLSTLTLISYPVFFLQVLTMSMPWPPSTHWLN